MLAEPSGLPIALVTAAANRPDHELTAATLAALQLAEPAQAHPVVYADSGYDWAHVHALIARRGWQACIAKRRRGRSKSLQRPARTQPRTPRWVVERTHSWLHRFRRILVRWEKRADTYQAMVHLACALITWGRLGVY